MAKTTFGTILLIASAASLFSAGAETKAKKTQSVAADVRRPALSLSKGPALSLSKGSNSALPLPRIRRDQRGLTSAATWL